VAEKQASPGWEGANGVSLPSAPPGSTHRPTVSGSLGAGPHSSSESEDGSPVLLGDRYRLDSLIGRGGMAEVWRATDMRLERPVALKLLGDTPAADERRFGAEVRTLARFSHPNLIRLLDAGEHDGRLFLVMDLVEGATLASFIARGPLASWEVARVGRDVADALAYVHSEGIVHRDIKPANILINGQGVAFLADFGIARLVDSTGLTATGLMVGTPAYLAPEQITGGQVGPEADIFALGLVLLESLTGQRPPARTFAEIAASRTLRAPEIPSSLGPGWSSLIRAMTALEPTRRPSARQVAKSLASRLETPGPAKPAPTGLPTATVAPPTLIAPNLAGQHQPLSPAPAVDPAAKSNGSSTSLLTQVPPTRSADRGSTGSRPRPPRSRLVPVVVGLVVLGALVGGVAIGEILAGHPSHKAAAVVPKASPATSTTSPTSTTSTTSPSTSSPTSSSGGLDTTGLSGAAGNFLSDLVGGVASGNVSPSAAQQLFGQLQPLLFSPNPNPGQQAQQLYQLAQTFYQAQDDGQISGYAATALQSDLQELASALGSSLASPAITTAPPGGPGKGHGSDH